MNSLAKKEGDGHEKANHKYTRIHFSSNSFRNDFIF